jgi:hypothetical protein
LGTLAEIISVIISPNFNSGSTIGFLGWDMGSAKQAQIPTDVLPIICVYLKYKQYIIIERVCKDWHAALMQIDTKLTLYLQLRPIYRLHYAKKRPSTPLLSQRIEYVQNLLTKCDLCNVKLEHDICQQIELVIFEQEVLRRIKAKLATTMQSMLAEHTPWNAIELIEIFFERCNCLVRQWGDNKQVRKIYEPWLYKRSNIAMSVCVKVLEDAHDSYWVFASRSGREYVLKQMEMVRDRAEEQKNWFQDSKYAKLLHNYERMIFEPDPFE